MKAQRIRSYLMLLVAALMAPAAASGQDARPVAVTRAQFASIGWLVGVWRGSGGQYPAFYEEYRWKNDSTLLQRNLSDSTARTATDSAEIAWRGGFVYDQRAKTVNYVVTRLTKDSLQFAKRAGQGGGFLWVKESETQWKAVLAPPPGRSGETIYQMRLIRRP